MFHLLLAMRQISAPDPNLQARLTATAPRPTLQLSCEAP